MNASPETGSTVIEVARVIGPRCVEEEDGRRLMALIRPVLLAGKEVELDFAGVESISVPFLAEAVGRLLEVVPLEEILRRLVVNHMTVRDVQALRYTLEHAGGARDDRDTPPPGYG
ncbi:MAG: STAS-like domain-containing protein [Methanospirillum sp.]|nr:STAS-like domain-containing protein [Methanospirillum sp.]